MTAVTQEAGGGGFELPCVYFNPSLLPKEKTADSVSICTVHPELAAHVCMAHPINQQVSSTRCSLPSLPLSTGLGELSSGMLTFLSASHPPILVTLGLHVHIGYGATCYSWEMKIQVRNCQGIWDQEGQSQRERSLGTSQVYLSPKPQGLAPSAQ